MAPSRWTRRPCRRDRYPIVSHDLTSDERGTYYHLSEGGELYPLDWLLALEMETDGQPPTRRPFVDNIERYGMLPDPRSAQNPYGLPVGVTFGRSRLSGQMMMGLNCTACHVGQVEYGGHSVRIDGGPSMAFVNQFIVDLIVETDRTLRSPRRLSRFWHRVREARKARRALGNAGEAGGEAPAPDEGTWARIKELLTSNRGLLEGKVAALHAVPTLKASALLATKDGYGRTDAFGVGRNELFGATFLNGMPSDAPVSFPHTWGMRYTGWLQWGANTNSVMERNIGQALGVGAVFDPATGRSSVNIDNLHRMEQLTYKLEAPAWPAAFPAVDAEKAERGRQRFVQYCAPCHQTWQSDGAMRVYKLFALNEVGTDPNAALNYEKPVKTADGKVLPFPYAALRLIKQVKQQAYAERGFSPGQIAAWESRDVRQGRGMGPDVPCAAARSRQVARHARPPRLPRQDARRHLGDRPVPAQRIGADDLRPAASRRRAPRRVPRRTARVRPGEARHPDRPLAVHDSIRMDAVRARHAAIGQLEFGARVEVLPAARRHLALRDHRVPEGVPAGLGSRSTPLTRHAPTWPPTSATRTGGTER